MTGPVVDRPHHRADVQALRGVAVLIVVLFHAGLGFPGGFVGVDVFFVISGFVIAGLILREVEQTRRFSFRDFYARRARRLFPLLAVVSLLGMAASAVLLSPTGAQQEAARTGAAASLFGANAYLYRFGVPYFNPDDENPFLHTWSLSVEEQTYLVLPLLLVVAWRIGRRFWQPRLVVAALVAVASLLSLVLSVLTSRGSSAVPIPLPERFAFYLPVTRLWEFGIGVLLAIVGHRLPRAPRLGAAVGVAGIGAIAVAAFVLDGSTVFPGVWAVVPVAGAASIIVAGTVSDAWKQLFARPSLVWIGDLSYGWYLLHWPLIVFAAFTWPGREFPMVLAAAASLPLAVLARTLVEDRYRHDSTIVGRRALALTAWCVLVPPVGAVGLAVGADRGWGIAPLEEAVQAQRRSTAEGDGCASLRRTTGCLYEQGGAGEVVLIGDSHAGAISDMLMGAAASLDADFGVWTRPGCPVVADSVTYADSSCEEWSRDVLDWLSTSRPDVVVIHVASVYYVEPDLISAGTAEPVETKADAARAYARNLEVIAESVASNGGRVVVLGDVPIFPDSELTSATVLRPRPPAATRVLEAVRAETADLTKELRLLEDRALMTFVDPVPILCSETVCSQRDGEWLYRDADHLAPAGSERLRPLMEDVLGGVLG